MIRYSNLGGNSGVTGYDVEPGVIDVYFRDGSAYRYTDGSAGAPNIATMHSLAEAGRGLNAFINRRVKYDYEVKLR